MPGRPPACRRRAPPLPRAPRLPPRSPPRPPPDRAPAAPGGRTDPLGRPSPTAEDDFKLPGSSGVKKSLKILRELRRRAGDPQRPAEERNYLERLLERF